MNPIKTLFLLLLVGLSVAGCSSRTPSLNGFWLQPEGKAIVECTGKKMEFTIFRDGSSVQHTAEIVQLDETRYELK